MILNFPSMTLFLFTRTTQPDSFWTEFGHKSWVFSYNMFHDCPYATWNLSLFGKIKNKQFGEMKYFDFNGDNHNNVKKSRIPNRSNKVHHLKTSLFWFIVFPMNIFVFLGICLQSSKRITVPKGIAMSCYWGVTEVVVHWFAYDLNRLVS